VTGVQTCALPISVKIMESRPMSKTKRWRLVEVVEKVK
jgi:small subunit ribosomal protein S17